MTSVADDRSSATRRRRRDAAGSRRALLTAAAALFDERGYEAATIRDIGERARVDPALIARYFGGKEGLYLATLTEQKRPPLPGDPVEALTAMLSKSDGRPFPLGMLSPTLNPDVRACSARIVRTQVIEPLAAELERRDVAQAELRAETLLALAM